MIIVAYLIVAISLPLWLYGLLRSQLPGEYGAQVFAALFMVVELIFISFVFVTSYWWAVVLNLLVVVLVVASNLNRLRLHMGVWGILADGPCMRATPEQIRDFMIEVAKAYPKVEGWLVVGISPLLTIRFKGKFIGQIGCQDMTTLLELVDWLVRIHPEHAEGVVGELAQRPVRLIYKRQPGGKVALSTSHVANPR